MKILRTLSSRRLLAAPARVPLEWLQGRQHYCVWVIDLADPVHASLRLRRRLAHIRTTLAPWIRWGRRQPHVTLQVCGFRHHDHPPAPREDDFTPAMQAAQRAALEQLVPRRFSIDIGPVATFDSAAYLRVFDPDGALPALRQALTLAHDEFRTGAWVPHVTLGLYRRAWRRAAILAALPRSTQPHERPIRIPIHAIALVSYDADRLHGPLHTLWRHELAPRG